MVPVPRKHSTSKRVAATPRLAVTQGQRKPVSRATSDRNRPLGPTSELDNASTPGTDLHGATLPTPPGRKCIKTFGEVLPGVLIESVVNPQDSSQLYLCVKDPTGVGVHGFFDHADRRYIPQAVGSGIESATRFPCGVSSVNEAGQLVEEMKQVFSKFTDMERRTTSILITFVLSTWFVDCFEIAPVLNIFGPEPEVSVILRLLGCFCYHPILCCDITLSALHSLALGLRVTLLINQVNLAPRVERALLASSRRHFYLASGRQPIDIFGARALYRNTPSPEIGLSLSINPARRLLPRLTQNENADIANKFQPRLLAYRMNSYERIHKTEIKLDPTYFGFADQVRTWSAAIPENSDLRQSVLEVFSECRDASSAARYEDPNCLVAEAALMFCHRKGAEYFLVRELAEKVNDLLIGRHAGFKLEDRKVGSVLRKLGIQAERRTQGYRVKLDRPMRERIHRLAAAYHSLSLERPQEVRCAYCESEDWRSEGNERMNV